MTQQFQVRKCDMCDTDRSQSTCTRCQPCYRLGEAGLLASDAFTTHLAGNNLTLMQVWCTNGSATHPAPHMCCPKTYWTGLFAPASPSQSAVRECPQQTMYLAAVCSVAASAPAACRPSFAAWLLILVKVPAPCNCKDCLITLAAGRHPQVVQGLRSRSTSTLIVHRYRGGVYSLSSGAAVEQTPSAANLACAWQSS